jgi:hypothetical protein
MTGGLAILEFETGTQINPMFLSKKDWELKHKITPFYKNVARMKCRIRINIPSLASPTEYAIPDGVSVSYPC